MFTSKIPTNFPKNDIMNIKRFHLLRHGEVYHFEKHLSENVIYPEATPTSQEQPAQNFVSSKSCIRKQDCFPNSLMGCLRCQKLLLLEINFETQIGLSLNDFSVTILYLKSHWHSESFAGISDSLKM